MSAMLMSVTMRSYGPAGQKAHRVEAAARLDDLAPAQWACELWCLENGPHESTGGGRVLDNKTLRMDPHSKAYYEPERTKATNPLAH